ncbi:MAG TPA: hypothetical protein VKA70_09120 [Blastocatellia bacterium]|nr:hypothetical protein [Blastocatellia bacterium]
MMGTEQLFSDTDDEAERALVDLARATPVWKKFRQVAGATEACRAFAKAGIRSRYPAASDEEVKLRLAALVLDRETMIRVYGWDPDVEGY